MRMSPVNHAWYSVATAPRAPAGAVDSLMPRRWIGRAGMRKSSATPPVWRSGRSSDTMPRHDGPRSQARIQGRGVPRQRRGAAAAHPRRVSPAPARVRAAARSRHHCVLRVRPAARRGTPRALLRRGARAGTTGDRVVALHSLAGVPLPRLQRWRRQHNGSRESRRGRRGRAHDRAQHRPPERAASEPVHHARSRLPVSLLLHAQALVRASRARHRRLPGRVRDARRAVRDSHPLSDPQAGPADRDPAVRIGLLERDRELPRARPPRNDLGGGPRVARLRRHTGRSARPAPGRAPERERDHCTVVRSLADLRERGLMAASRESERALLLRVARRAMIEHGLEPAFPPAALAEAGALSAGTSTRDGAERDLRSLPWCSIDNDDSRDLDQLTVADSPAAGRTTIRVAVADVSATVAPGSALDRHARTNTTSVYTPPRTFPMLPDRLTTDL